MLPPEERNPRQQNARDFNDLELSISSLASRTMVVAKEML
jgi:hypothetical protein